MLQSVIIVITLLVMNIFAASPTKADEIVERLYFRDSISRLDLDQVRSQTFQPYKGVLSAGYGRDTVWLKLSVRPSEDSARGPGVVRVRPSFLDHVEIYDFDGRRHVSGDFYPISEQGYRSFSHGAKLELPPQGGDIYVSIRSDTARSILAEVLTLESAGRREAAQLAAFSGYFVLVALSAFVAIIYFSRSPGQLIGWFALRQCIELMYLALNLGIARYFLSEAYSTLISPATNFVNLAYVGVTIVFLYVLICEYKARLATHIVFRAIMLVWAIAIVLVSTGSILEGLRLNILVGFITAMIIVPAAVATGPVPQRNGPVMPKSVMVALCLVIAGSGAAAILVQLGLFQNIFRIPELTLYAAHIHGFVTTLCVTMFMFTRSVRLAAEHEKSERLLLVAKAQAEQDRKSREEQEKLLSMLAHELRTPISVMKLQLGPWLSDDEGVRELRLAVEEMTAVLEKTVQAGQVSGSELALQLVEFDLCAELARIVDRFPNSHIELEHSGAPPITNDLTLLRIVLNNLVENAVKYGSPDYPILVAAHITGSPRMLEVSVANRKSHFGFPDPDLVFKKYFRGPHAHRKSGSGLGLFIVDTIARRLRGEAFYVQDGDVIKFGIRLPPDAQLSDDNSEPRGVIAQ